MFGSKNSELTRKYSSTWLEAITFGFSSRWRVWNSQKPIAGEHEREHDEHAAAPGQPPRRPLQPAQQREQQRERHVEEHDLLERLRAVARRRRPAARRARSPPSSTHSSAPERSRGRRPAWRAASRGTSHASAPAPITT